MRKMRYAILAVAIGVAYFIISCGLLLLTFVLSEGGRAAPSFLAVPAMVLAAPMLYLPLAIFGRNWWGNDSNLIFGLSACNALIWGCGLSAIIDWRLQLRAKSKPAE